MGGEKEISAAEAASLLGWWLEAGVDVAVLDEPRDWLAVDAAPPAPAPAEATAVEVDLPETLDLFRDWLGNSAAVPLARAGSKRVLPKGLENAPVMLLAEMPSREDAAAGSPISGEAWALTERMLAAIGLGADQAYCATLSCFHAPGARMAADELDACAAIARRHIALAKPQRLLLLGDAPARALLGKSLAAARGHVHKVEGVRTIATFHPRFLVNRPSDKSLAWKDLLLLMEESP